MATAEQWLKLWDDGFHHHHHEDEQHSGHPRASGPGHHGTEVDKYLLKHLNRLTEGKDNLSIFVTLCGNSPDLAWLCEKGYKVVGCELSAKAVEQLFENRVLGGKIDYDVKEEGAIKIFSATDGKKLEVYVGDFFGALSPDITGTFDCIWDCHGIISVPANQHVQYAEKVTKFLKPGGRMLFSTLDCDDKTGLGPGPAPVSATRITELFPSFSVELIENPKSPWHDQKFGSGNWTNPIVLLTFKQIAELAS